MMSMKSFKFLYSDRILGGTGVCMVRWWLVAFGLTSFPLILLADGPYIIIMINVFCRDIHVVDAIPTHIYFDSCVARKYYDLLYYSCIIGHLYITMLVQ